MGRYWWPWAAIVPAFLVCLLAIGLYIALPLRRNSPNNVTPTILPTTTRPATEPSATVGSTAVAVAQASPQVSSIATPTVLPTPAASPTTVSATLATSVPSATPAPTTSAVPTAKTAACAMMPVRGFGALYQSQPDIATRLGCARAPELGVQISFQPFEKGLTLTRADRPGIIALANTGKWQIYPDNTTATPGSEPPGLQTLLGAPKGPKVAGSPAPGGAVEEFQGGTLLWTTQRIIYVLYADGSWEQQNDTFVEPTPTSIAETGGPSPAASPVEPTPSTESATSSTASCAIQPIRGFGLVYHQNAAVAAHLGCALNAERAVELRVETFEHGTMLRRGDTNEIFVLVSNGTWTSYPDTYQNSDTLSDVGTPPAGLFAPIQGFAKTWQQQPGVRTTLGWATEPQQAPPGAIEEFAHGQTLWIGSPNKKVIDVLYADGTWQSFPDTFVDATPTSS